MLMNAGLMNADNKVLLNEIHELEGKLLNFVMKNKENDNFKIKISGNVKENETLIIIDNIVEACKKAVSALREEIGPSKIYVDYIHDTIVIAKVK